MQERIKELKLFKNGSRHKANVQCPELCARIRKRLNVTKKTLPDSKIKQITDFLNKQLRQFLLDNYEGCLLTSSGHPFGVMAVSKHMPKEMRENKFEKYEELDKLEGKMSPWKLKMIRKRYETNINRRRKFGNPDEIFLNLHSMFYTFRIMWFNKRNCKTRKADCYAFEACSAMNVELARKVGEGKEYREYGFDDFYRYKIKPVL